ncbi:hypothetical protein QQY24_16420 [Streptomyces sp. TG1A-8]|uniref:hypothetical protein n=1 Tax=Streptomyces sp. TG1A-8 TaxID=3051385 RepID=UPI00265BA9FF|nr:hypothetical protein [Streptomyces sp. TG1A-8]MDO0926926.1 hypothetical protein [Streptomyces sp. TG1A-8]
MLRNPGRRGARPPRGDGPVHRRLRLLALAGAVAAVVALPLAVASTGQVGEAARGEGRAGVPAGGAAREVLRDLAGRDAGTPSAASPSRSRLLGLGLATAARCGPELSSPDGIEAQTCVLTQGGDTWARTYYRNATGEVLDSVLSLMGPGGRTVGMRCATGTEDEPATCETPREATGGSLDAYTAVTEFSARGAGRPLLLRSASNMEGRTGS